MTGQARGADGSAPPSAGRRRRTAVRRAGAAVLALATLVALGTPPAAAQSLDQLRASGAVCERPDGLLRALSGDAAVRQQVDTINRERLAAYERLARETNTTIEQVRVVSGEKLQAKYGGCP
ncbi:DUF1318 domain-containing protein [Roseospira goensis]|uniref:Uncharacterized protein YdbL (DUF1318 family) n=1 Tax=Roseospira goensis TaxID=391922 RepID=A0A7W6WL17_9PROT|nr:DUF1318 domain-containing protein [Roseospira goensis]MBB4286665.1 uncharacterized protein YdbL (DUF1318 family) [Roseospira goensis]